MVTYRSQDKKLGDNKKTKTFLTAVMLILLLLIEPAYSNFFSVAPDLELSSLILNEMKNIIDASPALKNHMGGPKDEIQFYEKKSKFKPLATSNNRMDGEICRHNLVIGC